MVGLDRVEAQLRVLGQRALASCIKYLEVRRSGAGTLPVNTVAANFPINGTVWGMLTLHTCIESLLFVTFVSVALLGRKH